MQVPRKTTGYKSEVINDIIDYLEMSRVLPSADHRIEETTHGVFIKNGRSSGDSQPNFPFRLTSIPTAIRVRVGGYTRNGTSVTLAPDSGEAYKSITALVGGAFGASATYIVYGILDAGLVPTTLTVAAAAALPADTQKNLYFQIGTATTNADSEINGVVQTWWGGNRDDDAYILDADSPTNAIGAPKHYSLEQSAAGGHVGELQLYNWVSGTSTTPDYFNGDVLLFREYVEAGEATPAHYKLRYASMFDALYNADWTTIIDNSSSTNLGDTIINYLDGTTGTYWKTGEDTLLTCHADQIGKDASTNAIDLAGSALVNGTVTSLAWSSRIAYQEDGTTPVLNYNSTGWHLNFSADDAWSASGLKIGNATAASSTTAGSIYSKGGLNLAKNLIVQDATVASAGAGSITTAGGVNIAKNLLMSVRAGNEWNGVTFGVDVTGKVTIIGGTDAELIGTNNVILNPGSAIVYGTIQGTASIPNWVNLGGVVGTDIIEIDASDLQPTDKILVRR